MAEGVTDIRISDAERSLLASMIGKTFDRFYRDTAFHGSVSRCRVFNYAWVVIGGDAYDISCEEEPHDYFEDPEGIPTVHVTSGAIEDIRSGLVGTRLVPVRIDKEITDIEVVDDILVKHDGAVDYALARTSAIVFELGGAQVVFLFWHELSAIVTIMYGVKASTGIPAVDDLIPQGDRSCVSATREATSLKEWAEARGK